MSDVEDGRISLDGFEDAVIAYLAKSFRFSGPYLSNVPLKVGRHLFVQVMDPVDTLVAEAKVLNEPYDPEKEPTISVFTLVNAGIQPTSSRGGRHEWILRIVMRFGVVLEECKARLEELIEFMKMNTRGAYIDRYAVKGIVLTSRPSVFQIEDSDQAYCEVHLRLFAVPRVTE